MAFQISSCFILNHSDSECELAVELQFLQNMSDFYELIDFAQLFISTAVRPATYSISSNFLLTYLSSGFEISQFIIFHDYASLEIESSTSSICIELR